MRSIRWRLALWLAFLLAVVLTGFGVTADRLVEMNRTSEIDRELEIRVAALGHDLREAPFVKRTPPGPEPPEPPPPGHEGPPPEHPPAPPGEAPTELHLSHDTDALFHGGYYYVVWYRDGRVLRRSPDAPRVAIPPLAERDTLLHFGGDSSRREVFHCSGFGDCVLAGRPLAAGLASQRRFRWMVLAAGLTLLVLGVAGVVWLTSAALRPIGLISGAAVRISEGNLAERVAAGGTGSELDELAGVLNRTFARLEAAFTRERQFTADAAHELRTPLAVMIAETQTALRHERDATEYRAAIEVCHETAQQMRGLTDSLLELARFDAAVAPGARPEADLAELVGGAAQWIQPLAAERAVRIVLDLEPVRATFEPARLRRAIINLLSNAVEYNREGGEVRVFLCRENGRAALRVEDTGVGIPAEALTHVFERFYRVNKARSRAGGHAGLGLAITKAIVEAEGGRIEARSTPGEGSCFTIWM